MATAKTRPIWFGAEARAVLDPPELDPAKPDADAPGLAVLGEVIRLKNQREVGLGVTWEKRVN